jgi:hypothetical protein
MSIHANATLGLAGRGPVQGCASKAAPPYTTANLPRILVR